jgi:hypothetical protein
MMVEDLLRHNSPAVNPVHVNFGDFASERTWQLYCIATKRPYPSLGNLSSAQKRSIEKQCAMFGYLLDKGITS